MLNLGQNRIVIRPQIGVLHIRGQWSYDLTGSTFIFGDNNEYDGNSKLEQDPVYAVQGHVIRVFDNPGYWAALSAGYGRNGQSTLDGDQQDDGKRLFLSAVSFGMPVGTNQGLNFAYVRKRTNTNIGSDTDSLAIVWALRF